MWEEVAKECRSDGKHEGSARTSSSFHDVVQMSVLIYALILHFTPNIPLQLHNDSTTQECRAGASTFCSDPEPKTETAKISMALHPWNKPIR